jgi:hypothetical protein
MSACRAAIFGPRAGLLPARASYRHTAGQRPGRSAAPGAMAMAADAAFGPRAGLLPARASYRHTAG